MKKTKLIKIMPQDDVAVATEDLLKDDVVDVEGGEIALIEDIPFGHKAALRDISRDEHIIKYGYPIGRATAHIKRGEWVHTHNVRTNLSGKTEYTYNPVTKKNGEPAGLSFEGYLRDDGQAGTRNEIWILPTVGCINATAQRLAEQANALFQGRIDGVFAFPHNMGCSQTGDDQKRTMRILAGIARNPNAGGVLILSLGCENNHLEVFKPYLEPFDHNRMKYLVAQDVEDEFAAGMRLLEELCARIEKDKRERLPVSALTVGFKCGGSDAFSGITANALCGRVNDALCGEGARTLLTEVPEMFGAETILMNRAKSEDVFHEIVHLIDEFKDYYSRYGQPIYENPSPGNKKGGISTLEEKSLGCIQKGGQAVVNGVIGYGQRAIHQGLNILAGPGNDQVSCTNLVASGAGLILFTTGRGNPLGAPVPTLKIASNSRLAEKKANWIDFDSGRIISGATYEEETVKLLDMIMDIASGRKSARNEVNGYREISIFRDGVIL